MNAGGELIANGEIVSVGNERIPLWPSLTVCVPETSGPCTAPPDWMAIAYLAYRPPWKVDWFELTSTPSLAGQLSALVVRRDDQELLVRVPRARVAVGAGGVHDGAQMLALNQERPRQEQNRLRRSRPTCRHRCCPSPCM